MRAELPKVHKPVLLIHSRDDRYVLPGNMENLYNALIRTSDRSKILVTESGHVITRDAARRQVFVAAHEFIKRIESQS